MFRKLLMENSYIRYRHIFRVREKGDKLFLWITDKEFRGITYFALFIVVKLARGRGFTLRRIIGSKRGLTLEFIREEGDEVE